MWSALGFLFPRQTTSTDLIFDLVFSAGLTRVASAFRSANYATSTVKATWLFYVYFQPLYWHWLLTTEYLNRFDTEDWGSKLFLATTMSGVVMYSLWIPECIVKSTACKCTHGSCAYVFLALVCLRVLTVSAYVLSATVVKKTDDLVMGMSWRQIRSFCVHYAISKAIFLVLYGISAITVFWVRDERFALWEAVTVVEMVTWLLMPFIYARRKVPMVFPPLHVVYLNERLRRFVLISMSTMVTAVLQFQEKKLVQTSPYVFIFVALCPFVILPWQVFYFDFLSSRKKHALRVSDFRARIYLCLHSVLIICITIVASSITQLQHLNNQESKVPFWYSRTHYGVFIFILIIVTILLYLCHSGEGMTGRVRMQYRLGLRVVSVSVIFILAMVSREYVPDRAVFFIGLGILFFQALGESAMRTERTKDTMGKSFLLFHRRSRNSKRGTVSETEVSGLKKSQIVEDIPIGPAKTSGQNNQDHDTDHQDTDHEPDHD
eukprot:c18114_g1_i2.p2 GENE.c18114_g1_i2~~c18114_g1_i2.p2  ORF type:complete len:491 (-),score=80.66 c18114_g1_i2:16-1488(-)